MFGSILGLLGYLDHLLPGPPDNVRSWLSLGIGLKLEESLLGYSHKFCVTFTPVCLPGRTNCRPKVLLLGWGHSPSAGNLPIFQKVAGLDSCTTRSLC